MNKFFSGFDLKVIGITFMLIDHVNTYLGTYLEWPLWVSLLGRFVAPLFVFLLVEGFHYTHDRKKYFLRLFIGGLLMYVINIGHQLLIKADPINPYTGKWDPYVYIQDQNIFMTLALLFLFIWGLDTFITKSLQSWQAFRLFLGLCCLLPLILMSEGGIYELIMGLIFYLFRGNMRKISLAVLAFTACLFLHTWFNYLTISGIGTFYQVFTFSNEYMMVAVLPFIYFYNGKRGGSGAAWQQKLFYYFYPIHLIIIYFLQDLLVGLH